MVSLQDISEYRKNKICVSKLKYISTENMLQNFAGIIPYTSEEDISGVEFCIGDTLLANIRPYLRKAWLATHDGACSTDVLALCPSDITPAFLNNIIEQDRFIDYVMSGVKGSKMPRGDKAHILAYETAVPSLLEQEKINSFMQLLHQRIAKIQMEIELLKKYKRGVTEAIFTKDLRFTTKGVPYPQWDKKYVGDICKIQTGKSNTQDETSQGSYPFYVRSPIVRKSNRYLFDCEAVLTVGDGVGTGKVFHYVTGKFDLHQRVYAMTDFKIVSGKYFYYYFSHFFYDRVMRMTAKTSVDSVRYEMIDKMTIQIPCHEEQQQIVSFLDCIENSVIEAEKTLNLLEKLKSGCLQQLFI